MASHQVNFEKKSFLYKYIDFILKILKFKNVTNVKFVQI